MLEIGLNVQNVTSIVGALLILWITVNAVKICL